MLVPRITEDGRILSEEEAKDLYRKTHKHLGIFTDSDTATAYSQALHKQQASLAGISDEEPEP